MKIKSADFEVSAPDLKSCPHSRLPEFAFIGRSNVGKSSLINLLADRRDLAHVSDTPGKTKLINFYRMNGTWSLVDLPGYGYAHVGRQERVRFNDTVADYLEQRRNIRCVFVLIDSRLEPQKLDLEFVTWLTGTTAPFVLVFTKADKQSAAQSQAAIARFTAALAAANIPAPAIFLTSSKTRSGRTEILGQIEKALADTSAPRA